MSENKLKKFLDKELVFVNRDILNKNFVLISDSKGHYLSRQKDLFGIKYYNRSGARFGQQYFYIARNIHRFSPQTHFLVWLGTCDLTTKSGRYIQLRHKDSEVDVQTCLEFISKFEALFHQHNHKCTFLEIPPYTIVGWNQSKGHPDSKQFKEQDKILAHRLALINQQIRLVNEKNSVRSPRFRLDLLRTHKGNRPNTVNYKLYKDGIHPTPLLASCWHKSIIVQSVIPCI